MWRGSRSRGGIKSEEDGLRKREDGVGGGVMGKQVVFFFFSERGMELWVSRMMGLRFLFFFLHGLLSIVLSED